MVFDSLSGALPNPIRWLGDNYQQSEQVMRLRQVVAHGDLNGDNLFVDKRHAWAIDFERTGYKPMLYDFVVLIQDIITRIALFDHTDLSLVYELMVALCRPNNPKARMTLTEGINQHPEARKVFQVVQALQRLAFERARYIDQRELLWGLLLTNLFVASCLQAESPRWWWTMLCASVIAGRLDRWGEQEWPLREWPTVVWVDTSRKLGIDAATLRKLRTLLQSCDEFSSDQRIRTLFTDDNLSLWRHAIPEGDNVNERIDRIINYLWNRRNAQGEHALYLFLLALADRYDPMDNRHAQLLGLAFHFQQT